MTVDPTTPTPRAWAPTAALGLVVALGLLPFRVALPDARTTLLGTATDSVHAVWSLWYVAFGGPEDALWPAGIAGTVVGGPTILLGFALARLVGPAFAYTACCALQVGLALVGVGLLARRLGGGAWSAPIAALLLLCGRPLLAHVALGVPEGAAIGWLALALVVALGPEWSGGYAMPQGTLAGALFGASLEENPYTLPLVAVAAGAVAWKRTRARSWARLAGEMTGGAMALGTWFALVYRPDGGLDAAAVGRTVKVLGTLYVAEGMDGRAHAAGLLRALPTPRFAGQRLDQLISGGANDFIGFSAVGLAILAARRRAPRAGACVVVATALLALALGSFPLGDAAGVPGPFLYVNLVIGWIVRPLTQPVRYLVPAGAALAIAGALQVVRWSPKTRAVVAGLALVEALTVGSPSLRIPSFDLATWGCLAGLDKGAVATGAVRTPFENADAAALALQVVHGRPGTHPAIGGWRKRAPRTSALEGALAALDGPSPGRQVLRSLKSEGVRWAIVDDGPAAAAPARACGGVQAIDLAALDPAVRR